MLDLHVRVVLSLEGYASGLELLQPVSRMQSVRNAPPID